MEKTKLGISTGLMAAILYAFGLFSGMSLVTFAAIAYVLIREEDRWLKKSVIRVTVLIFAFPLINVVIGFIPDLFEIVARIADLCDASFDPYIVVEIENILKYMLNIAEYVTFILLGIFALKHKDSKVPLVDSVIDKNMD